MSTSSLSIGTVFDSKKPFSLPEEALVETFFFGGIRGSGKTTAVAVMCEEFCKVGLPWIMLDPVSVGWGLRAGKDGSPKGGLPVVVFGGQHGDLTLDKSQGAKIAEVLTEANACAIIDLKLESKTTWRKFITDFALKLLEITPETPRHIFIEEAGELLPQKAKFNITAQCKEAVERLVRLGRNQGYGCSLVNQRPATIDKDVLEQVGNLILLRIIGTNDRKACRNWLEPKFELLDAMEADGGAVAVEASRVKGRQDSRALVNSLASLPDGCGYFWSPAWMKTFEKIQFRDRTTFHPGATRRDMRGGLKSVELMPVASFVQKMKGLLSRKQVVVGNMKVAFGREEVLAMRSGSKDDMQYGGGECAESDATIELREEITKKDAEIATLHKERDDARLHAAATNSKIERARKVLEPFYESLKSFFEESKDAGVSDKGALRAAMEIWLVKAAGVGCKRAIETLIDRGATTQRQLATLIGVTERTWRNYRAWLTSNNLVKLTGDWPEGMIELKSVV